MLDFLKSFLMEIVDMKVKVKFDNAKIKIGYDGKIENYSDSNQAANGFYEIDLDFLNVPYTLFPPPLREFGNNLTKAYESLLALSRNTHLSEHDTNGYMLATGHDIYNYVARFGIANFQIQTVLRLDGRLNPHRLKKAVRLSIEAEPILGCRFVVNNPPYWKRLDDLDKVRFCSYEETNDLNQSIKKFLESPLDMDKDPMVLIRLIRCAEHDTLCIKVNHACTDGTGTKEYLQLLSDIYSRLDNNDIYIPKPGIRSRSDQDTLFSSLGIVDPESAWNGELDEPKNMWNFPWHKVKPNTARVIVARLPYGYINTIAGYGKRKGATINDILVTAYYRAMFEMSAPEYGVPMNISMTADLRRYLPEQKTEAIRCFSGGFETKLDRIENEPFSGTLYRVVEMMKNVKNSYPGLQSAIGLERVEKAKFNETLDYYRIGAQQVSYGDKCSPVLSNLGFLNKTPFIFGSVAVTDAYIVPPVVNAPGLLLCIGTYNDTLTMSMSYYESQVDRIHIERLLSLIRKELIEGCKI
jgi:NRPS condensation-like uncharacterized protein